MRPLDQLTEIAQKAVAIGNDLIKSTRPQTITEKTDRDTYTDVDVRIERDIRTYLAEVTPEIGFIGEEEGRSCQVADSECVWVLDPIDGTANFVHGVPLSGISLALLQGDCAMVGAISLPYSGMHYIATLGNGAYANGKRIRTSTTAELAKSMIAIGDYALGDRADEKNEQRISLTAALAARVERIRMFGSAAHDLVWLAEGRIDAVVIMSNNTLDVAAGVLIAREAGAVIRDSTGRDHSSASAHTIGSTAGIADDLIVLVRSIVHGREPD
ncbi:inositol monophosphatase family protein [Actinosynnema sp. NPDC059335]|uniref:inositol monophosphatase family protein n=1 Tax=Actinosynnema sp. NPDC059335 TaxID=3346804 RepID=UPI00366CE7FB